MPQSAVRCGVAQRGQPGDGFLGGQPQRLGRHIRHGLQQRAVQQLLVQPPDLVAVPAELREQHLALRQPTLGGQPRRAGEPTQRGRVVLRGEQVRAQQPLQLQPVLQRAQEPVGAVQLGSVVAPDVAVRRQRLQRLQRVRAAQPVVGASVHELQHLHGELHVPQAAGSELELATARIRRNS